MTFRSIPVVIILPILLGFPGAEQCYCSPAPTDQLQDFRQLLQKIAANAPDPCDPPSNTYEDAARIEDSVFVHAANIVTQELNAASTKPKSPNNRATEALKKLERDSTEINAAWPEENRFHFQILDIPPALVLKMTIRTHDDYYVFGIPEDNSGKPNQLWQQVGSDYESDAQEWRGRSLKIYPLHRGPSGNARFLAMFSYVGCAGNSMGVAYDASEWNPKYGYSQTIIKQAGALGLDASTGHRPTPKDPFAPIGELRTENSLITLPYCWFSAIDTWDNPSLCAVDTYDLSGDNVRFRSRAYNRPDLVPIAKAIEYAQQRDFPALLGYVASGDVARRMIRDVPPSLSAEDLRVTRIATGKENVIFGYPNAYRFDVEKRAGRWMVVAFNAE
jgi:hypothetical protein